MSAKTQSASAQSALASSQLPKYLFRRDKTYYFKRRIPADVAHGFAKFLGQIWKSLDTDSLGKAKVFLACPPRKSGPIRKQAHQIPSLSRNLPTTDFATIHSGLHLSSVARCVALTRNCVMPSLVIGYQREMQVEVM